jgi:hypothetical protein
VLFEFEINGPPGHGDQVLRVEVARPRAQAARRSVVERPMK